MPHASGLVPYSFLLFLAAVIAGCSAPVASPSPSSPASGPSTSVPSVTPKPSAEPGGSVYLALGDSITFGIGVPRPREQGYVARVADVLAGRTPAIGETRVFAVPGETAAGFLERRLDDVVRAIDDLGPRVELVTIGLGANELLRTRRQPDCLEDREGAACRALVETALSEAADALDRIVGSVLDALADAGSEARVLLLAYYGPDPDPVADATVVGPDGTVACDVGAEAGLDDRIACVAEARGVELVDLHRAFRGRELELTRFGQGDVHPNAAGYAVIAEAILEVVSDAP